MKVFWKQTGKPPTLPQGGAPGAVAQSGAPPVTRKSSAIPLDCAWATRLSSGAHLLAGYAFGSAALNLAGRLLESGLGAMAFQSTSTRMTLAPRLRRIWTWFAVSSNCKFGTSNIAHWLLEAAAGAALKRAPQPVTAPAASITAPKRIQGARIRPIKLMCGKPPGDLRLRLVFDSFFRAPPGSQSPKHKPSEPIKVAPVISDGVTTPGPRSGQL